MFNYCNSSIKVRTKRLLLGGCLFFAGFNNFSAHAQNTADSSFSLTEFVQPADSFNAKRLGLVLGTEATLYTGATIALYQYWYTIRIGFRLNFSWFNTEMLLYIDKIYILLFFFYIFSIRETIP